MSRGADLSPTEPARAAPARAATVPHQLLALQRAAGNRATGLAVQRQLARSPNTVSTPFNLATQILSGLELGITPPVVNGTELPIDAGLGAAAAREIRPPTIATTAAGGQFEARVTAEPANQVGAHVKLPAPPPASRSDDPTRATMMLGLHGGTPLRNGWFRKSAKPSALDKRVGNTTVTIKGMPSNGSFHRAIQTHEERHADDHWAGASQILGAWDARLRQDLIGRGDSAETATADLYRQAGGTPAQLGAQLDRDWVRRSDAFHKTADGRQSDLKAAWVAKGGSKIDAYWGY